jgi:hypothetical protein
MEKLQVENVVVFPGLMQADDPVKHTKASIVRGASWASGGGILRKHFTWHFPKELAGFAFFSATGVKQPRSMPMLIFELANW